jgi:hypothetical protein
MVYEELKKVASGPLMRQSPGSPPLSSLEISVIAAVSKLAASVATYPSQVARFLRLASLLPLPLLHNIPGGYEVVLQ